MVMGIIPQDFKEYLKLLNQYKVEYLLVGGYAVGYYGYPRATIDMDIWISTRKQNLVNTMKSLQAFGVEVSSNPEDVFQVDGQMLRIGVPPLRLEILTTVSGLTFDLCYRNKQDIEVGGVIISVIDLADLKKNKKAAGRHKDLNDLEHLD